MDWVFWDSRVDPDTSVLSESETRGYVRVASFNSQLNRIGSLTSRNLTAEAVKKVHHPRTLLLPEITLMEEVTTRWLAP
jgi:hypothetical protein